MHRTLATGLGIVCAWFTTGCDQAFEFRAREPPVGAQTVILAVEGAPPTVFGGPVDAFRAMFGVEGGERLFVGYYEESLIDLGIVAEPDANTLVRLVTEDEGRTLAPFLAGWTRLAEEAGDWEEVDETPKEFSDVRLKIDTNQSCSELIGVPEPALRVLDVSCDRLPGSPTAPGNPLPPTPPSPVVFTCTDGESSESFDSGVVGCAPFDPDVPSCGDGERIEAGACVEVGATCAWPTLPPDAIYVDDDAMPNGNGTSTLPYDDLMDALATAAPGATIALAPGVYSAALWTLDVALVGQCAAQTTVAAPRIELRSRAEGVTFEAAQLDVPVDATAVLEDVVVATNRVPIDGVLELRRARVRDTDPGDADLFSVTGRAVVEDVTIGPVTGNALAAVAGEAELLRVAVFDVATAESAGMGIVAHDDAIVTLNDVSFDRIAGAALFVDGARVDVDRVAIREPSLDRLGGRDLAAVLVFADGRLEGERLYIERPLVTAMRVTDAAVRLDEVVIEDTETVGAAGVLSGLLESADVTLRNVHVRGGAAGLLVVGGTLVADNLVIEGALDATRRYGVRAQAAAAVTLNGAHLRGIWNEALAVLEPSTTATVTNLTIEDVGNDATSAEAIIVAGGGAITARRVQVEGVVGNGIDVAFRAARGDFEDVIVRDVRAPVGQEDRPGGAFGAGPLSKVRLVRASLTAFDRHGFLGYGAFDIDIDDLVVETKPLVRGVSLTNDPGFELDDGSILPDMVSRLERVRVTTATTAFEVSRADTSQAAFVGAHHRITVNDLLVENAAGYGVMIDGMNDDVTLDRIKVIGTRGTGVILTDTPLAVVKNLTVVEGTEYGLAGATALQINETQLRLERFTLRDNETLAFEVEQERLEFGEINLSQGSIENNPVAIRVPVLETLNIRPRQVILRGNRLQLTTF
ncbi:MAG: hypothetical protein RIT81_45330 [Deltaproteobacteria bacterium]